MITAQSLQLEYRSRLSCALISFFVPRCLPHVYPLPSSRDGSLPQATHRSPSGRMVCLRARLLCPALKRIPPRRRCLLLQVNLCFILAMFPCRRSLSTNLQNRKVSRRQLLSFLEAVIKSLPSILKVRRFANGSTLLVLHACC